MLENNQAFQIYMRAALSLIQINQWGMEAHTDR